MAWTYANNILIDQTWLRSKCNIKKYFETLNKHKRVPWKVVLKTKAGPYFIFQIHPVSRLKRHISYIRLRQSSVPIVLKTVYVNKFKISANIAMMARITISAFVCVVGIVCGAGIRNMTHFLREPVVCEELSNLLNPVRLPNDTLKVFYLEQCLEVCLWDTTCKVATFVKDLTCRTYFDTSTCQQIYSDEVQSYAKIN